MKDRPIAWAKHQNDRNINNKNGWTIFFLDLHLRTTDIKQIQQKTSIYVWLPYVVVGRFETDIHYVNRSEIDGYLH